MSIPIASQEGLSSMLSIRMWTIWVPQLPSPEKITAWSLPTHVSLKVTPFLWETTQEHQDSPRPLALLLVVWLLKLIIFTKIWSLRLKSIRENISVSQMLIHLLEFLVTPFTGEDSFQFIHLISSVELAQMEKVSYMVMMLLGHMMISLMVPKDLVQKWLHHFLITSSLVTITWLKRQHNSQLKKLKLLLKTSSTPLLKEISIQVTKSKLQSLPKMVYKWREIPSEEIERSK